MDVLIPGLVEDIILYVDERCGRPAAWVVAIAGVILMIGVPIAVIVYLLR